MFLDIISVPDEIDTREEQIRDYYDRPILRSAIKAGADIILTGDKDFLESRITDPRIMSAAEFMNL